MGETQFEINEQPLNEQFIKVREQKNLTLESVSKSLNLSVPQLEKLESQQVDFSKMSTFERGYIRNYAQFLEIDIQSYDAGLVEVAPVSSQLRSLSRFKYPAQQPFLKKGVGKAILIVTALIVLGAVIFSMMA